MCCIRPLLHQQILIKLWEHSTGIFTLYTDVRPPATFDHIFICITCMLCWSCSHLKTDIAIINESDLSVFPCYKFARYDQIYTEDIQILHSVQQTLLTWSVSTLNTSSLDNTGISNSSSTRPSMLVLFLHCSSTDSVLYTDAKLCLWTVTWSLVTESKFFEIKKKQIQ